MWDGSNLGYELILENLGNLSYVQSMCYDYANDVLSGLLLNTAPLPGSATMHRPPILFL